MPNRNTLKIKPIAELVKDEFTDGLWIDPFCGNNSPAHIKNDINPNIVADYHIDAIDFLKQFEGNSIDGVILDPPYSVRQVSECYKRFGFEVTQETTRADWYTNLKREIARITKRGGKVISFGWNSGGIGKKFNFDIKKILLVPHGGVHNDTIVTVEIKI